MAREVVIESTSAGTDAQSVAASPRFGHRECLAEALHDVGAGGAVHTVVRRVVEDHQVDAVTGGCREGTEEQRRLDERVESGFVGDTAGTRPARVDHDDDAPVAFRAPGPDDEVLPPRGRAPVDGPHVVAAHVVAQRVELGAVPAELQRGLAVEFAEPCQP